MKKMYLVTTKHLEKSLWFRDAEDFRVAMNYIAIVAWKHPEVIVWGHIYMSNHAHFILLGTEEDVIAFVNSVKQRYSLYYRRKYGVKKLLRRNFLDVKEIPEDNEAREKTVAYVITNCVSANICAHPSQYEWGSGNTLFNPTPPQGKPLSEFSTRKLKRLLRTEEEGLPDDWLIGPGGYILPSMYVDVKAVEALFRKPQRMNYFIATSSKTKMRLEAGEGLPAFKDQTILAALPDLCMSLFQKRSFKELASDEQAELAKQIRFRFSADATQIARVCGVSYAEAAELLDSLQF
jgi:REP element-mobilizing transposase RayT